MSVSRYADLAAHVGHKFECVFYSPTDADPAGVALECVTCHEVMIDFDSVEPNPDAFSRTCPGCGEGLSSDRDVLCNRCGSGKFSLDLLVRAGRANPLTAQELLPVVAKMVERFRQYGTADAETVVGHELAKKMADMTDQQVAMEILRRAGRAP